jgi:hypothetical protein
MFCQKHEPVKPLTLCAPNQFAVLRSREPEPSNFIGPILKDSRSQRRLVDVSPNMLAPVRRKPVKLLIIFRRLAIDIALQITETDVNNDVDMSQFGQRFK